ncbi:MAG: VanW family protein [Candidatus Levybacteria bacterium]|nr:VanW family protein [Candidatus Levybacteria bacterium]
MKILHTKKHKLAKIAKETLWVIIGASLGIFLLASFALIIFEKINANVVYPGITADKITLGGKTEQQIKDYFSKKNDAFGNTKFVFLSNDETITIYAKDINYGFDENLIAKQAISLGRSEGILSNINLILSAYLNEINLKTSYHYSEERLQSLLTPIANKMYVAPVDAVFNLQNGKVSVFTPSSDGQEIDIDAIKSELNSNIQLVATGKIKSLIISIPVKILKPKITIDKINNLGIKELIGEGNSLFQHSIVNRVYNVTLAATRLNGILVAPNEVFSFNKALGDVSAFTGYQQAYVIENGRTVLGDGGGVCQVSTTLFRAVLNAGLPIIERHAHAYRVGYYEQDSPPGIDATVYSPNVDFKFKNDTDKYILIQTSINPDIEQLTFSLYGTTDGRSVTLTKPIVTNEVPPPPDVYQDDPTLPKGTIKQIDFSAWGANVSFARTVMKDNKEYLSDKFTSNFQAWRAIYLRGTKE